MIFKLIIFSYLNIIVSSYVYDFETYKFSHDNQYQELGVLHDFYKNYYYFNRTNEFKIDNNGYIINTTHNNDNYNYNYYNNYYNNLKIRYKRNNNNTEKKYLVNHEHDSIINETINSFTNSYDSNNNIYDRKGLIISDLLNHYYSISIEPLVYLTRQPYNLYSKLYRTFLTWTFDYSNIYYTKYNNKILKIIDLLNIAFLTWGSYIPLNFTKTDDKKNADIYISFEQGKHKGDNTPFDGLGGILAHASYPNIGESSYIHFDYDENWYLELEYKRNQGTYFLETAIHEIGHTLGLKHTEIPFSIMSPFNIVNSYYKRNGHISNHDIRNVQHFYGIRQDTQSEISIEMNNRQLYEDNEEKIFLEFKKKKILDSILLKANNLKNDWRYFSSHTIPGNLFEELVIDTNINFLCNNTLDSLFFIDTYLYITYNDIIWRQDDSSKTEFLKPNKLSTFLKLNISKTRGIYIYEEYKYISILNENNLNIINLINNSFITEKNNLKIRTLTTQYLLNDIKVIAILKNNSIISFENQYPIKTYKFINIKNVPIRYVITIFSYLKYLFFMTQKRLYIYNIITENVMNKTLNFQPWLNCGESSLEFNDLQTFFDNTIYKKIIDYK